MRYLSTGMITLALLSLLGQCGRSRDGQSDTNKGGQTAQTFADPQAAATQSLATFRQLVSAQNFKELGFESQGEIANARLGEPLRVAIVRLDQLRQYQTGSDPSSLLTDTRQLNYPVLVGEQPRAFVAVQEVDGKWRTASLGDGGLAKQFASFRAASGQTAAAGAAGTQDAIVHVAALGISFVSRRADNKLLLTPLASHPEFNLRAGATQPAEQVFASLVEAAKALKEDAPM